MKKIYSSVNSAGGVKKQALTKSIHIGITAILFMRLMAGCSSLETEAPGSNKYILYHKPLPEASRALEQARLAGKDKECPAEFNAAEDMVKKAYEVYDACHTQEAIKMAQEAIAKINALCPPKEVAAPAPAPAPAPTSAPAPEVKEMTFPAALFATNKADLTPEGKEKIKKYREQAKAELSSAVSVKIIGYTDNAGSAEYNKKLSLRRANGTRLPGRARRRSQQDGGNWDGRGTAERQ